jgi:hypothetical protein
MAQSADDDQSKPSHAVRADWTPPKRPSRAKLRTHVSLNGFNIFQPLLLLLLPQQGIPIFTDVILVSLYVIGCMLMGGLSMSDFVGFFDPGILLCRVLASLTARRKSPAPTHKAQRSAPWGFIRRAGI